MPNTKTMPNAASAALNPALPSALMSWERDSARLCPMLAGSAMVSGGVLTVRGAQGDVEVKASPALLKKVFELCDGMRSIESILKKFKQDAKRDEFNRFLNFLLDEGALIDANLYTLAASRTAWQGSPFGLSAPFEVTATISTRFHDNAALSAPQYVAMVGETPLDTCFQKRVSSEPLAKRPAATSQTAVLAQKERFLS